MNLDASRKFWRIFLKLKKILRITVEVSSFILLIMSFEKAFMLKSWSVLKPWQVSRLLAKIPRLIQVFNWACTAA